MVEPTLTPRRWQRILPLVLLLLPLAAAAQQGTAPVADGDIAPTAAQATTATPEAPGMPAGGTTDSATAPRPAPRPRSIGAREGEKVAQYLRASWRLVVVPAPLFAHVGGADSGFAGDIGDGARDFQHPVVGPGRQPQLFDSRLQQAVSGRIDGAPPLNLTTGHLSIAIDACPLKALGLPPAGRADA